MSYQIISHKLVKSRKPHHCWGCAEEFSAGSILWRCVSKEDVIRADYWCSTLPKLVRWRGGFPVYYGDFADSWYEEEAEVSSSGGVE